MLNILYAGAPQDWPAYQAILPQQLSARGISANFAPDLPPDTVDYIVYAPVGPVQDFSPFTRLRAVLNLWAGVEQIVANATLRAPLTRMVDMGLSEGMREYVAGHVLRHHLGMDAHLHGQDGVWRATIFPPLARHRHVGILGLGALGAFCGQALVDLGFQVSGWSRTQKSVAGITCLSGQAGLQTVLRDAEILVLLLPLTDATQHVLNAQTLAMLRPGVIIVNPGRGGLIDENALLAALNAGHIGHATLDVFQTEPLPADHAFWRHPRVTVTPHIAASSRPETCAEVLVDNIERDQAGQPMQFVVDRSAGY